ncbi:MAG: sialate O-acetylesterase [Planctomycetes bacterium]|nr:sialate O-acetylesterase [Planctomycetota bacterium]
MRAIVTVLLLAATARAEVRLPKVIAPGMVVQQQSEVAIWGWAGVGEAVEVTASWGATARTSAGKDGRFSLRLATPKASETRHRIEVRGSNTLHLDDVLVGEVWLCGGQSNMEWAFAYGGVKDAEKERAAAADPWVRLFDVPNVVAAAPKDDCDAAWQPVTPDTVNGFSCVGWFFARELRRELGVPVGLIGVNWGGTVAQAWMRREALATFPRLQPELERVAAEAAAARAGADAVTHAWAGYWTALDANDLGARNGWAAPGFDDSGWHEVTVPDAFAGMESLDGAVWYRRTFETLPHEWVGQELELALGAIDDMDQVFFDGRKIGGIEVHGRWSEARTYRIPAELTTPARHVLAVRVVDTGGGGGIAGADLGSGAPRAVTIGAVTNGSVAAVTGLTGGWKRRLGCAADGLPPLPSGGGQLHPNVASVLWNGLVAPVVPYGIRGALWYQGESNRGRAAEYLALMEGLIADWRAQFGRPQAPFLFVQIAPFNYDLSRAATAELRQAQLETLRVPGSGMAVTTDIGHPTDIHPGEKQEVARRLALWALSQTYHRDVGDWSGPLHAGHAVEGDSIRVRFTHAAGLRARDGQPLREFEVCGADGQWHPATATIDGETVVVRSPAVPKPTEVRLGFADSCNPNLVNGAGLPVSPFCRIPR